MKRGKTRYRRSGAAWWRQTCWGGVHGGGEQTPAVAQAARARILQGRRPVRGQGATVRRRMRELVPLAAAARARGALTMGRQGLAMAENAEAWGSGKGGWGTRVQAAAGQRMSRVESVAVSGRRLTETRCTREEAARKGSEQEGGSWGNVSTSGKGASARSAEGRASASTIGEGAGARSAEGGASASTIGKGASARSAEGRASASTFGKGARATIRPLDRNTNNNMSRLT